MIDLGFRDYSLSQVSARPGQDQPVFQHQLLQEQSSKLEMEMIAQRKELKSVLEKKAKAENEVITYQKSLEQEKFNSRQLTKDIKHLKNQATNAKTERQQALILQDSARWELVLIDFEIAYGSIESKNKRQIIGGSLNAFESSTFDYQYKEDGNFIFDAGKHWPKPYENMLLAIDSIKDKRSYPKMFYDELRALVKAKKSNLYCEKPNFNIIFNKYSSEVAALDSVIDIEVTRESEKKFSYIKEKERRLKIIDSYISSSKNNFRIDKIFKIEDKYEGMLSELEMVCEKKAESVMEDIKRQKWNDIEKNQSIK